MAVAGDALDEVPAGVAAPYLTVRDEMQLIDTTPVLDALRQIHRQDGLRCSHCLIWNDDAKEAISAAWPCPTMAAAQSEALLRPLVMRRIKVESVTPTVVG